MSIDQTSSYVRDLLRRERSAQRQGRFTRSPADAAVQRAQDALTSVTSSASSGTGLPPRVAPLEPESA